MANQTLLTNGSRISSVKQMYYSPVAQVQNTILTEMYCFLSHVNPWPDPNNPPVPTEDQLSIKQLMKSIFVAKHINTNDISPVIQRVDWASNIIYDYYKDNVNMTQTNPNGSMLYNYYVRNKYDQVFKCLWNNSSNVNGILVGAPSTLEPYFEPGTYNTNNVFQGSDGYKWKYIYTIDIASKVNFMDTTWMPVKIEEYASNPLKYPSVGYGNIDVINVTNGGYGYGSANSEVYVNINGSNTSPTIATAVIVNGTIQDILVTSSGANYISANVVITSSTGSGATAIASVSPIGGHGSDPLSELACRSVMITSTFSGPELDRNGNTMIPTDITYYQLGLVSNPTSLSTSPDIANSAIYKTSTDLIVAGGFGVYSSDELIYQGPSLAAATFTGTMLSFDPASNIIKLINTSGYLTTNVPVFGNSSSTVRTLLTYSIPDMITLSGDIMYIDNRSGITRSSDGIEQFKIVLDY